ncbi:hypothetical protein [Candidatus Nitrosocosmicus franklandus]|uniref:hypothetical protein n=1 Tax=Candidatus Nitrosocosmicus franklandianus TaxID=1798806 RepID=UPI00106BB2D0|nr:hypothetical protein [Candidatus Nitrosocosmicus franklandus]
MSSLFAFAFKVAYGSNPILYIGLTIVVFTLFWIFFNVFDELLYFSPILYFYLPNDAIAGFILSTISASLLGVVVLMNIYLIRNSSIKFDKSLISSSFLTILSSACASCSSIGFVIITTFGSAGVIATTFITNYQIPLRLAAASILILALYTVCRRVTNSCLLDNKQHENQR